MNNTKGGKLMFIFELLILIALVIIVCIIIGVVLKYVLIFGVIGGFIYLLVNLFKKNNEDANVTNIKINKVTTNNQAVSSNKVNEKTTNTSDSSKKDNDNEYKKPDSII